MTMKNIYVVLIEDRGLYGRYPAGSYIHGAYESRDDAFQIVMGLYPNAQSVHRGSLDPEKDSPYYEVFDSKTCHKYFIRIIETRIWQ